MVSVDITDIPNSFFAKVIVHIDANSTQEYYVPKSIADLITPIIVSNNFARANATRTVTA